MKERALSFAARFGPWLGLLLPLLLYWPTLHFSFLNWDDDWLVTNNRLIQDFSWSSLGRLWGDFSAHTRALLGAEYLPLRDLSSMVDWQIWGGRAAGFHLGNVLLYLGICALFLFIAGRLKARLWAVLPALLLFAMHPSHVESVAWIAGRKDLLALLFLLASFYAYLAAEASPRGIGWRLASLMAYALAALSKSYAVVFPLALLVHAWLFPSPDRRRRGFTWFTIAAAAAIGLALLVLHLAVGRQQGMIAPRPGASLADAFWLPLALLQNNAALLLWPLGQRLFPALAGDEIVIWSERCGGLILLLGLGALFFRLRRRFPWVAFALAWGFIFLLPFLQFVPLQNLLAYRYLFAPSAALLWASLHWATRCEPLGRRWRLAGVLLCLLALGWGVQSRCQLQNWRDSESLWLRALHNGEVTGTAWRNLINAYAARGEGGKALLAAIAWMQAEPRSSDAAILLLTQFQRRGYSDEALILCRRALAIDPNYDALWNNLGVLEMEAGRWPAAGAALRRALALRPENATAWNNLGLWYERQGQGPAAAAHYAEAWRRAPSLFTAAYRLAELELRQGRGENSCRIWRQILDREPLEAEASLRWRRCRPQAPTAE